MLMVTLMLSWHLYDSEKWIEHDVERITIAGHNICIGLGQGRVEEAQGQA